jgi:hypothetical protein
VHKKRDRKEAERKWREKGDERRRSFIIIKLRDPSSCVRSTVS